MGQVGSASSALKVKGNISTLGNKISTLADLAFLTHQDLVESINELNSATRDFTDRSGKQLCFSIKKGTDTNIFWKTTIRIRCLKVNTATNNIESSRLLKIRQYIIMHDEILDQISVISNSPENDKNIASDVDPVSFSEKGNEFSASTYFHPEDNISSAEFNEDLNECCVCMDNKACVILSCDHEFCEKCIDNWTSDKKHSNCPLCRKNVTVANDSWILTEKCESSDYESEVKGYLVGFADRKS